MRRNLIAAAIASAMLISSNAQAAEISSEPLESTPGTQIIFISGPIQEGDLKKFRQLALAHEKAVVAFKSSGGLTLEAIEIGKIIRIKGYDTFVASSGECNSACALIWLAGATRFLSTDARVGFHATYTQTDGVQRESGVGNAIVGSYLTSLHLADRAVIFATSAGPSELNWLTTENASAAGIPISAIRPKAEDSPKQLRSSATRETSVYKTVGNWTVSVDHTLENSCFVFAAYDRVYIRLGFDVRPPKDAYFMILGDDWKSIDVDEKYKIDIKFGDKVPWNANAQGVALSTLKGLKVSFTEEGFFEEFMKSPDVRIFYKEREIQHLNLSGSSSAVAELVNCQDAQPRRPVDPFAK